MSYPISDGGVDLDSQSCLSHLAGEDECAFAEASHLDGQDLGDLNVTSAPIFQDSQLAGEPLAEEEQLRAALWIVDTHGRLFKATELEQECCVPGQRCHPRPPTIVPVGSGASGALLASSSQLSGEGGAHSSLDSKCLGRGCDRV